MVVLGVVLLIVALIAHIPILLWVGIALIVAGIILSALGASGRPVGRRRTYW